MVDKRPPPVPHRRDEKRYWNEPNLGFTNVKRQHYVPQLFLRPFAADNGNLSVYDLEDGQLFATGIQNAAAISRYYDLDIQIPEELELPSGIRVSTESWLSEVERAAAPLIGRLIDDPASLVGMSGGERNDLARFFAAQYFRVPAYRNFIRTTQENLVGRMKAMAKNLIFNRFEQGDAEEIWAIQDAFPDHKWLGGEEPMSEPLDVASMLQEVQGFANLLQAMNWRVGRVPAPTLYTSDNPLASHVKPVREWWDLPAFANVDYYIPLSPAVLLRMQPRKMDGEVREGEREAADFSNWDASVARHVVSDTATRYLFGSSAPVSRECASACLQKIDRVRLMHAIVWQGFDPRPPKLDIPD